MKEFTDISAYYVKKKEIQPIYASQIFTAKIQLYYIKKVIMM